MKRLIIVLFIVLFAGIAWTGQKEELNWEYRALVAEFNVAQQMLPQFRALQDFGQRLDKMGFTIKDGQVVERPKVEPIKPAPEKKKGEPKK